MTPETTPRRRRGRPPKPRPPVEATEQPAPDRLPALPFAAVRELIVQDIERPDRITAATHAGSALVMAGEADITGDVGHLPVLVPGVRFELDDLQRAMALTNLRDFARYGVTGKAKNSQRSIRADWITWLAYCRWKDCPALPVQFDDLADFIQVLVDAQRKRATIEHIIYTIRHASTFYGCPDPMESQVAKAFWSDTCRTQLKAARRQAKGLNREDVLAMASTLDATIPQQARDAALVLTAYDLLGRRDELANAKWEDLDLPARGYGHYTVPRSKTDQEGKGIQLTLSEATVQALIAWRRHASPGYPYVFHPMKLRRHLTGETKGELIVRPMDAGEIPKIWNRLAAAAGLPADRRFSGHSARVGATQDLTAAGASISLLMRLGRWTSPTMPALYGQAGLADQAMDTRMELLAKHASKKAGATPPSSDKRNTIPQDETA